MPDLRPPVRRQPHRQATRWFILCATFALAIGLIAAGGCRLDRGEPRLGGRAQKALELAKRRNQTSVDLTRRVPDGSGISIGDVVATMSLIEFAVTALDAVTTGDDMIVTWHRLRASSAITPRPPGARWCDMAPPATLRVGPGEFGLPLMAGALRVRGVNIVSDTLEGRVVLHGGGRYAAIGAICERQTIRVPFGPYGIFELDASGNLTPLTTSEIGVRPFLDSMSGARTLDGLRSLWRRSGSH